ncbi:MAG: hypothetical protein PHY32_03100 [Candidatus Pacebacteria bacterium]|jgi:hypothetical protein|nr:hypothetical protein [Candidatus Paceibacterota bacterium]
MPTLKGSDKQDVIYTFGIKCFKDANDKVGISAKDVKVTVSKCSTDGKSEEDSLKAICDGTKEKCKNGKIN